MGITAKLVDVGRGQFEVVLDTGTVIFSKAAQGRFPEPKELVKLLREQNK